MERIEILVEEKSMEEFLSILLPKILPREWIKDANYFIRSFQGKSDLQKSIPKKVKVFSNWHQKTGLIIVHDQDSADCFKLKSDLKKLVTENGNCPFLVRIVCKELEAWYLGDFEAIRAAYPAFKSDVYKNKSKYRNPDLCNASEEIKKILPDFQKIKTAKQIAHHIDIHSNRSESFNQFVKGLLNFTGYFS